MSTVDEIAINNSERRINKKTKAKQLELEEIKTYIKYSGISAR